MKKRTAARRQASAQVPVPADRADYSWLLIFAAAFVAYLPALNGQFLWDDSGHVTRPDLQSLAGLWRIWTEVGATQQYYPLLHSAFWLEHQLWGDSVVWYHATNVALHAASAVLLVHLLRRLAVPGALLAGLVFAVHPVCVESVAWISEQKNTLSGFFYLASAYVYLTRVHIPTPPTIPTLPFRLSFALFIGALLSKTVTATLPAALLLVVWWQRGRLTWRDVRPLVPWFAAACVAALVSVWVEHEVIGARGEAFTLSIVERLLLAGRVIWFYGGKLFWPVDLVFIYPRWNVDASQSWQYLYPAAALALVAGLAIASRSTGHRGPLAGALYFCGTLVPVLGFVNVYPFRFSFVADHFQYLASLGLIVPASSAVAMAVNWLGPRWPRAAVPAAIVAMLAVLTWNRSAVYADTETLFRDTVAHNPQAWMAYQNLGTELANQNRLAEAVEAYEAALRARPDYAEARDNLVLAHMKLGDAAGETAARRGEAIHHYESVLRLAPDHFRARYNLGTLLMDIPGRDAEAIQHLERAVQLQPDTIEARVNLGVMLADEPSRTRDAITHLQFAISRRPDLAPVREILDRLTRR